LQKFCLHRRARHYNTQPSQPTTRHEVTAGVMRQSKSHEVSPISREQLGHKLRQPCIGMSVPCHDLSSSSWYRVDPLLCTTACHEVSTTRDSGWVGDSLR
jgi:hypothetical protein